MTETRTMAAAATALALAKALEIIGSGQDWRPRTPEHEEFLGALSHYSAASAGYDGYVKAFAAPTAAEINTRLKLAGLSIRLDDWPAGKPSFGIAGVTDVLVNWHGAGAVSEVLGEDGRRYPAFTLSSSAHHGPRRMADGRTAAMLNTREGLQVRIQMTDDPGDQVSLMKAASRLHQAPLQGGSDFTKMKLPMVKLDQEPDVRWLKGLYVPADRGEWELVQAVMQTKFSMNQYGASAVEGMAGEVEYRSIARVYEVNRPFLITIGKPESPTPIFGAYVGTADWRDPGTLRAGA